MPFEDIMITVSRWLTATEALAAAGAELAMMQAAEPADRDVAAALRAVSAAADLSGLDELPPPQREMLTGMIRMCLHQAADLVDNPGRPAGWTFTDPAILQGWGRGSMMVASALAAAPELAGVRSFLDVGTGIGLLAIAAARAWPEASITGIDIWGPSLAAAAANIEAAGLGDRIVIRDQNVAAIDDTSAYDCAWCPTFFLTEPVLDAALPRLYRALRPGGWLVLGRMAAPPDPLAQAVSTLRVVRAGGADLDTKQLIAILEATGCAAVQVLPRQGPAPMEYVIGQRPATQPPGS